MKRGFAAALLLMLLLPAMAFAQGSVLLIELPQDAQMVENVEFDDGDFIQTYQLEGGVNVQLLRYASFDMTLGDLIASEWVGCTDVRQLEITEVGGCPAEGLRFAYQEEGQAPLDVTLVVVDAGETLVFEAVYPASMDAAKIDAGLQAMIGSMDVMAGEAAETADVG